MKPLFPSETDTPTMVAPSNTAPMIASFDSGILPAVALSAPVTPVAAPVPVVPPVHLNMALVNFGDDQIEQLGAATGVGMAGVSKRMLSTIRAADADVFGTQLNELIATAKGLDPNKLKTSGGLLTRAMNLFGSAKEAMMQQYQVVESRMDVLLAEMGRHSALHKARIKDLEELYQENHRHYLALEADVKKGEEALAAMAFALSQPPAATDVFAAQAYSELKQRHERLEKRIDDLRRGMMMANQMAPQLRMSQDNARGLAATFTDINVVGIPMWRNVFALYLIQVEAKTSAAAANAGYDAINEAFRTQADMLGKNAEDIANLRQRSMFDFSTLEHCQKQLIGMFDKVDTISKEGRARRQEELPKLQQLEKELLERFVATSSV